MSMLLEDFEESTLVKPPSKDQVCISNGPTANRKHENSHKPAKKARLPIDVVARPQRAVGRLAEVQTLVWGSKMSIVFSTDNSDLPPATRIRESVAVETDVATKNALA